MSGNVRGFLGSTEINRGMEATLTREPEYFWYYNNGVTIVCDDATHRHRLHAIHDVRIVWAEQHVAASPMAGGALEDGNAASLSLSIHRRAVFGHIAGASHKQ